MENNNVNIESEAIENTQPTEATEPEGKGEPEEVSEVFSKAEVDSMVARAVSAAVMKAKQKANQTSEERIASLERELAIRDNHDYVNGLCASKNIDIALAPLLYSEDSDSSDEKVKVLTKYLDKVVAKRVEEALSSSNPIELRQSTPATKQVNTDFLSFYDAKK